MQEYPDNDHNFTNLQIENKKGFWIETPPVSKTNKDLQLRI